MKISSVTSRPSSRSITQSITGRPATLSIGLGTRWVWGRSRVPLPASGMITCISASAVAVLESHQIVQLGRGRLEYVAVGDGLDLVNELGGNVRRLPGREPPLLELGSRLGAKDELAAQHVHGLVLPIVILETQHMAGAHVEDLAHVAVGARPDQLVAPGLVHSIGNFRHSTSTGPTVR